MIESRKRGCRIIKGNVTSLLLFSFLLFPIAFIGFLFSRCRRFSFLFSLVTRTALYASPVIHVTFVLPPAATVLVPINKLPRIHGTGGRDSHFRGVRHGN